MTSSMLRLVAWAVMATLLIVHNDFWLWNNGGRWLGLPAGLAYHVIYCLVTTAALVFLVRVAWPRFDHGDDC